MGEWLSRFVYRHSGAIAACWMAIFVIFGSFSARLPSIVQGPGLYTKGSSYEVQRLLEENGGMPEDPVIVVFQRQPTVLHARFSEIIDDTLKRLAVLDGVAFVQSPLKHREQMAKDAAYALIGTDEPPGERKNLLNRIRDRLPHLEGITIQLTGKTVVQEDVNQASMHDFKRAERFGIPLAFIILLLSFGGFWYALLPVLMGLLSVSTAMGFIAMLGTAFDLELSNFILNVIPMTGLALCLDFAFIMTNRFREELGRSHPEKALQVTLRTSGRAVYVSSACVLCGLVAVAFIPMPMFRSASLCAIIVVILSAAVNLSLVPALLRFISPWLVRKRAGQAFPDDRSRRFWALWAVRVMRRPGRVLLAGCCLMMLLLFPALRMTTAVPDARSLPPETESRKADEAIRTYFRQDGVSEVLLAMQPSGKGFTPEERKEAAAWIKRIQNDVSVIGIKPLPIPVFRDNSYLNTVFYRISYMGEPGSAEVHTWLRSLEKEAGQSGIRVLLGGEAKSRQEVIDAVAGALPRMLTFIVITNMLVLFAAFRSVLIPVKAVVMNLLTIAASFGVLVIVFQSGLAGSSPGEIAVMVPVFVFGLVFGVSMDYGVFLLSRMSEAFRETGQVDAAIQEGLASTGKLITAAAAILIAVTLPFAFGEVEGVRQLGAGIASAVWIDVTLLRLLVVPSLMKLLGKYNWWAPRWFRPL